MLRDYRLAVAATVGILVLAAVPTLAQASAPCPRAAPAGLLEGSLPQLSARFHEHGSLRIVTIGSSSTAGAGASSPRNNYPSQLQSVLQGRLPGYDIDVINVGANGQEVPDMLARFDRDVLAHQPDLVIWQFGSNGLLRGRPTADMEAAARLGIDRLKRAGVDVILMDLQHAPRIDGVAARDATLAMMQRLSESTHTALFHRYRLMQGWSAAMGAGYDQMVAADQLHMTDTSYRCMADALAVSLQQIVTAPVFGVPGSTSLAAVPRTPAPSPRPMPPP